MPASGTTLTQEAALKELRHARWEHERLQAQRRRQVIWELWLPYAAVRELILFLVNERRRTKRFELGLGKPGREGLGTCEIPGTKSAADPTLIAATISGN